MEQKHDVYLFISSSSGIYHDLSQEHVLFDLDSTPRIHWLDLWDKKHW